MFRSSQGEPDHTDEASAPGHRGAGRRGRTSSR